MTDTSTNAAEAAAAAAFAALETPDAPPAAPATATPPAPDAPAEPDWEAQGPPDGFTPERMWKEIKERRKGEQAARAEAKVYKEAFGGLSDDDRQAIFGFAQTLVANPEQAAAIASGWAQALTPEQRGAVAEAAGAAADDQPMTRAEFNRAMADWTRQQGTQAATAQMQADARQLGYDPDGPEYLLLLHAMDSLGTTDVAQAHAEVEKFVQSKIDAYVASKEKAAAETPGAPANGVAPSGAKPPLTDFNEIREAARDYLANIG